MCFDRADPLTPSIPTPPPPMTRPGWCPTLRGDTAAGRVRRAEAAAQATETARDGALLQLPRPALVMVRLLSHFQVISSLDAAFEPPGAPAAHQTARCRHRPRVRSARSPRNMVRLDAETERNHPRHTMAAVPNAETTLARALHGHYARASDEAYALIREALTTSGDIHPDPASYLSGSTRSPRLGGPRPWPHSATSSPPPAPATPGADLILRYEVKSHLSAHKRSPYVRSPGVTSADANMTTVPHESICPLPASSSVALYTNLIWITSCCDRCQPR